MQATASGNVHAAVEALKERGIQNPDQFLSLATPDAILRTVEWYDAQNGRVGTGVLVAELRAGGKRPSRKDDLISRQADYGEEIVSWLRQNFPEWNRDDGNRTHSAAIAAVIRLHHRHGKGRLTKSQHGAEIRAAVKAWEAMWNNDAQEAK